MSLIKTSFLSAIGTSAKLISAFVVMKFVALYAGPEGVAQFGQFMSIGALLIVFAGGGIGSGIIKYIAEYQEDNKKITRLLNAGMSYTLIASLATCTFVLVFSAEIAEILMGGKYESLIIILAFAQAFVALHNLIVAITNGMMDVRRLAFIHVFGAISGLIFTFCLGYFFKLYGVFLAYVLGQAFLLVISFLFFKRSSYFNWSFFKPVLYLHEIRNLSKFSIMTLTSASLAPLVQLIVRNILENKFSWGEVGYWQAVTKVSDAYLLFITMAISIYYLPKLSALNTRSAFKLEIKNAYIFLMPVVIFSALTIYVFRDIITTILFSSEFHAGSYLYAPQLIGDVVKIASYILSYVMLAKAMTRTFVFSEIFFSCTYVVSVIFFTDYYGLIGAMYAFIFNYFLYLLFVYGIMNLFLKKMKN